MRMFVKGFVLAAFGLVLAVGGAHAGERDDLIKAILDVQFTENGPLVNETVKQMAEAMGADRAGLTADERSRLDAGLRKTLADALREVIQPVLADPAKFSIEDLRAVATFNVSPAGRKWNGISSMADINSPETRTKITIALLRNVDAALLAKLFAASPEAQQGRRP